jgi:UDP-N-acetylmuramoyl-tripeptide--D-alanyl-D-alanine ligase
VGRGSEFVDEALARGAAATLVPHDAFAALARVAAAVRERTSARIVAITGSMGKTSTKDILAALSAPSAQAIAAEASFNNEIGVPLTLCRLEEDTEVCILELARRWRGRRSASSRTSVPFISSLSTRWTVWCRRRVS